MSKNYGAANLAYKTPFDENTVFPLDGFTEKLVVLSLFQLERKGLLNLSDPLNLYLPDLGFNDNVSLDHLLNHSSGFSMIGSAHRVYNDRAWDGWLWFALPLA